MSKTEEQKAAEKEARELAKQEKAEKLATEKGARRLETEKIEEAKRVELEKQEAAKVTAEKAEKLAAEKEANRIKLAQAIGKALTQEKAKSTEPSKEHEKLLAQYIGLYPSNKTFYITSDKQVFLTDALNFAEAHQRTLKKGELQTINIK